MGNLCTTEVTDIKECFGGLAFDFPGESKAETPTKIETPETPGSMPNLSSRLTETSGLGLRFFPGSCLDSASRSRADFDSFEDFHSLASQFSDKTPTTMNGMENWIWNPEEESQIRRCALRIEAASTFSTPPPDMPKLSRRKRGPRRRSVAVCF